MFHIVIADNQPLTSFAVRQMISGRFPDVRIEQVSCKKELVSQLLLYPDSWVVVDYSLFDFSQLSEMNNMSERFENSLWLISSEELQGWFIRQVAFSSSRIGMIFKDSSLEEYSAAFAAMSRKERFICHQATELLLKAQHSDAAVSASSAENYLTATEIEIVRSLARGMSSKEIAQVRNLSVHTVNAHRKNIFRKLQVNNVQEAIRHVISMGLIDMAEYYI